MEPGHVRLVALLRPPRACPSPEESGVGRLLAHSAGGWAAGELS